MSDYHRTVTSPPFDQATGRTTVAIDEGLRAYMLHVYNYMVFGLAITGLAALVIYMASVTGDPGAAAKILRNGVEVPARVAHDMYLTSIGYTMFVSPVKWIVILAPLALVFGLSFGIERLRPATAQLLFWIFAALMGLSPRLDLHGLHAYFDRARVLHHRSVIWGAKPLGVYDAT
jgi:hypothetical protein